MVWFFNKKIRDRLRIRRIRRRRKVVSALSSGHSSKTLMLSWVTGERLASVTWNKRLSNTFELMLMRWLQECEGWSPEEPTMHLQGRNFHPTFRELTFQCSGFSTYKFVWTLCSFCTGLISCGFPHHPFCGYIIPFFRVWLVTKCIENTPEFLSRSCTMVEFFVLSLQISNSCYSPLFHR